MGRYGRWWLLRGAQGGKGRVVGRDGGGTCWEQKGEGRVREWGGAGGSAGVLEGGQFTHCAHCVQQHSWMEDVVLDLVELRVKRGSLGRKRGVLLWCDKCR